MKRLVLLCCGVAILGGCSSWLGGSMLRSQSPDETTPDEPHTQLVGDLAVPTGMEYVRVEAVGLVTGLHGTGSDPNPSQQRGALMDEMQARGVGNPNAVLASGDVSLVLVQGILRPGIQKGDHFDIEIRVPSQSETTSLRGGYLLETRLTETALLGNEIHRGNLLARAQGPVLVDPTADPAKDRVLACRGRVLGGGVAEQSRPLGLVLTSGHHNVLDTSALNDDELKSRLKNAVFNSNVANAVNKRFYITENGVKVGVAKARDDQYIALQVHPRYKDNIARYLQVVRAVPMSESATERMGRLATLQQQLLEPTTAAEAAIQLEAIGRDGVDALLKGVASKDPETRFYAAEALAYLDRREAAEPLGQIARDQPAFRVFALTALSAMQEYAAYEQLRDLLSVPSAETRYGAFRALWAGNPRDALIKGEFLKRQFNYHVLDVAGPPMIHVTRSRLPEIVVFGSGQQLLTPLALSAGNEIMVTSSGGNEVVVSKFCVQDGDQKRTVSTRVDDVIRAIVELGGTYPDVVQAMQEAKRTGALASRFEVDALPEAGRTYDRVADNDSGQPEPSKEKAKGAEKAKARPAPELFSGRGGPVVSAEGKTDASLDKKSAEDEDSDAKDDTEKGFFAKMLGR